MKPRNQTSRVSALTVFAGGVASVRAAGVGHKRGTAWIGSTLAALLLLASARANGPQNPTVTHGSATFTQQGNNWVITTSNRAIIQYSSFDIAMGQWVRFVQAGGDARVLNRINSSMPTRIDGTLMANGHVYFVNPSGVIFGNNAVINCGSFAAVGGQLSDQDFLAKRDNFTNLTGAVVNNGQIQAKQGGVVALVGQHVANYGRIVAPQGTVIMASGKDVMLGEAGGRIFARIEGEGIARAEGVRNDGVIDAARGRTLMAAGDIYGMAVINTGRVIARDVKIDGGKNGEVRVAGQIDASNREIGGTGGRVEISGEKIALTGAAIDVSGDSGGGTAHIGGGREGQGLDNAANAVFADSATTIRADATRAGDGGEIVLYSHDSTRSGAKLFARGGVDSGNGGFIETSGGWLSLSGAPDTSARALLGKAGEWLIDPLNLDVVAGASSNVTGPPIFSPTGGTGLLFVGDLIAALSTNSVVTIQTVGTVGAGTGLIRFQTALDLPATGGTRTLNVLSAGGIEINQRIRDLNTPTGGGLNLNLSANGGVLIAAGADVLLNTGTFTSSGTTFTSNAFIQAGPGGVWLNHTGAVALSNVTTQAPTPGSTGLWVRGTSFASTGTLRTNGGKIDILASGGSAGFSGGGAFVDAGAGDIVVRAGDSLTAAVAFTGGNILFFSGGDANVNRNVTAGGALDIRAGQSGVGALTFGGGLGTTALHGTTINLLAGNGAAPGASIRFSRSTDLISALGPVTVSAGAGTFQVDSGLTLRQTMAGDFSLVADTVNLDGSLVGFATGKLRILTGSSARNISLGGVVAPPGSLHLSSNELFRITGFSTMDLVKSGQTGNISVDGATPIFNRSLNVLLGSGALRLNADLEMTGSFSNNGRTLIGPGNIGLKASSATFIGLVDAAAAGANFTVSSTNAGGLVNFANSIGSGLALNSLTVNGPAETRVRNLVRAGNAIFNSKTTIQSNTTFNGGPVVFNSSLDSGFGGPYSATFLGGPVSLLGGVGQTSALASLLTNSNAIVSGNVRTTGSQLYGGNLSVTGTSNFLASGAWSVLGATSLGADASVMMTPTGAIPQPTVYFAGAVDSPGNRDLLVTSAGVITFASDIGAGAALRNLTVNGGGLTRIGGMVRLTPGGFGQFFNQTELLSNLTLLDGNFAFKDVLDSGAAGPFSLTASGPGTVSFEQNVGIGRSLSTIDTTAVALTEVGGNVATTLGQSYSQMRLIGPAGDRSFSSLGGDLFYAGAVAAAATDIGILANTPGLVTFNSTVGSGVSGAGAVADIRRTGGGQTILRGNTDSVGEQSFDGDLRFDTGLAANAGGDFSVTGNSVLNGNVDVLASSVDFGGLVDSTGGARNLHVTSAGLINFGSSIGSTGPLGNLLVDGGGLTRLTTLVDAADARFDNPVQLTGDTIFQGGSVRFAQTLDSQTPGAFGAEFKGAGGLGLLTLLGPVGSSGALEYLIVRTDADVRSSISTANQQQFDKMLAITGPAIFNAGGFFSVAGPTSIAGRATVNASSVTFSDFVDSTIGPPTGELFVQSAGPILFAKSIGQNNQLVTLDVSGGGVTTINDVLNVQTADLHNNTLLGSNTHLRNGQFTFHQLLNSGPGGPYALDTLAVSTLALLGEVGGTSRLQSIDGLGAAQSVLGANVTTQDFIRLGATRLDGHSTVKSFVGPIDFGVITSPVARNLGVDTPGIAAFNGTVGTLLNPLASINRTGSGQTILKGNTFTLGQQSFAGDVRFDNTLDIHAGGPLFIGGTSIMAGDVNVASLGATFLGAVDSTGGSRNLHVTSAGPVLFGSSIGAGGALQSLTVDGGGVTTINSLVRVLSATNFANNALLGSDVNLQGGTFRFGGTLNSGVGGPYDLRSLGTGTIEFVGNVGSLSRLDGVDTALAADTRLHGTLLATSAIRLSELRLLGAGLKTVSSTGGPIDFLGAVAADANGALNVFSPALVEFHSTVGSGIAGLGALGAINRTGAGRTILDGNTTTSGLQSFDGDVDLNGALTLTSGGPFNVTGLTRMFGDTILNSAGFAFGGSVDSTGGPHALTITNNGTGSFASGLGGGGALGTLTIGGSGLTQFAGNVRLVPGGVMTMNQASEIAGPCDFRAGTLNFNSIVNAANGAINPTLLLIADAANFNADVGATRALASLDASGVTLSKVAGNVSASGPQNWGSLLLAGAPGVRTFNASTAVFGAIDASANTIGMTVASPGLVTLAGPIGMGTIGGGTALASLLSTGGATVVAGDSTTIGATTYSGNLLTVGTRTANASAFTVGGATALGTGLTVNGTNATFVGAVDSASGIFSNLLLNVTAESRFEGGVGQNFALANVRSNAASSYLRGSLRTLASGQSWFAGELRVNSNLTGVTTIDTGQIFVGRDLFTDAMTGSASNLTLIARATPTIEVAPIGIGGNLGLSSTAPSESQRLGNLVIGTGGATPMTATIVMARTFNSLGQIVAAGVSPSDQYTIVANNISMAAGQKLTVLGTLNMTASGGVTIADITTLGDMNVNAPSITIVSRSAFSVFNNVGGAIADIGTDLVAGGAVNFNIAPVLAPGAGKFSYSAIAGPAPVLQNFSFRQYPGPITVANFRDMRVGSPLGPNFILSLDFASLGPTSTNPADTQTFQPPRLGEVQRVRQSVAVNPADQELLRRLGLSVESATPEQIIAAFIGYSYFQNIPAKARPSVEAGDYVVTADRLWMKAVVELANSFKAEMQRTVLDESGNAVAQLRDVELRQMFAESWDRFTAQSTPGSPEEELAAYRDFLLNTGEERGTREELARLGAVITKLQDLGLTSLEAGIPEERLLEMVRPPALSTDDMRQMIAAVNASGIKPTPREDVPVATPAPAAPVAPVADHGSELLKVSKR
ncbi:MAG: filamentous hemagglutinin N-terminal domain-containing protein [Phycisphaeraceae bacterium]|nr:filamentous hemagglutinin N-terminal domain-containing protein [Phycisphaeraceae bacterium]